MNAPLNRPLPAPRDRWDLTHSWFWYNDQEIFRDTDDDLARKAEAFHRAGINHVMTFSCTHFRWSFRRHWGLLTETLARIVRAFHRFGIYVTEHHSAVLMHTPRNAEERDYLDRILRGRGSSIDSWPGLIEDAFDDPILIDDIPRSRMVKVNPKTLEPTQSSHRGLVMCNRNPHYRRAYFAYLETLYETGVDGIMTDDVAGGCACEFCQRAFTESTGLPPMPTGPEHLEWVHKWDDPHFRAWKEFELRSVEDFHAAVRDHYLGLGLRPLRPNYIRAILRGPSSSICLQKLPDLDVVFQEAGGWDMLLYSWPSWGMEAAHRFSVGRFRGIPSMTMMYPHRPDLVRLAWALAMGWGGGYTGTGEGTNTSEAEAPLRAFERRHARLLRNPQKIARLGFYDSVRNHEMGGAERPDERGGKTLRCWMQACAMNNVPYDLFSTEELAERLPQYEVVVLSEVAVLSPREIAEFMRFAREGGTLVWGGRSGCLTPRGGRRSAEELERLTGGAGLRWVEDGAPVERLGVGRGAVVFVPNDHGRGEIEPEYQANVYFGDADTTLAFRPLSGGDLRARRDALAFLAGLMPDGFDLTAENLPEGVTATVFLTRAGDALVVHLVNTAGILDKPAGAPLRFDDPVPFPSHAGRPPVTLIIRKPAGLDIVAKEALCHVIDAEEPIHTALRDTGDCVRVTIDPALLVDYVLIEVPLDYTRDPPPNPRPTLENR